jgi:hypothetical protein
LGQTRGQKEQGKAKTGKRKAEPIADVEQPAQKKRTLKKEEMEEEVKKPRSRLRRKVSSEEDVQEEKEENKSVASVTSVVEEHPEEDGMDIDSTPIDGQTDEERQMARFLETKRLPKGKKLITESKTYMDDKGYLVTKEV